MLNLDNIVSNKNENKNNNWPFRMLIIRSSGSGKTNVLLHLINNLHPIDKIYLYAKDKHEPKYEYLINNQMIWMMCLMILIIIIKIDIKKY